MTFSFTSFLSVMFFSSILIVLVWFFLKSNRLIRQIGIGSLFFCIVVTMIRLLIPFEFPLANNIAVDKVFPEIILFFETTIIVFGDHDICFRHILYLVWIAGVVIQLSKTIRCYHQFKKLISNFSAVSNVQIQKSLQKILQKYKKSVPFKIVQTSVITTPMILGARKPWIVVPKIELSEEEWQHILSHEVAHYYHGDLWVKIVTEFLCIIYWWNPFVYLLKKQIYKALEIHIDLTVTKPMSELEKIKYLECLLKIAKYHANKQQNKMALTYSSENRSTLSQRFHIILENNNLKAKTNRKSIIITIVPVIFLVVLSFFFVFEPYSISTQDESYTVELTSETAYLVQNPNSGYDVYFNDQYFATVSKIDDSLSDLPIYKNIKEAQKMKKLNKKLPAFILSLCIGTSLLSIDAAVAATGEMEKTEPSKTVQITKSVQSDYQITPFSDIIAWRYKSENNKLYKRLYNYSKHKWIGEWELC